MPAIARLLAIYVAVLTFAAASAAAATAPALQVVARSPLTVAGVRFPPRERVRVTVESATLTARAGTAGQFRVVFARVRLSPCQSPQVRAVGARGEKATLKVPPAGCMAALGG